MSGHDRRYQLDGEFVTINMVPSTTEKTAVLCSLIIALCLKKTKKKRIWCKEWLNRREILGSHTTILRELQDGNAHDFRNYTLLARRYRKSNAMPYALGLCNLLTRDSY